MSQQPLPACSSPHASPCAYRCCFFSSLYGTADLCRKKLFLPLICISVYAATLAPFVFWNGSTGSFAGSNPFYVQTIQYDGWAILFLFTVSAALLAGYNRNTRSKFANSAIMLFSFIAYIFTAQYICSGFSEDLFSYRYDYAYLAQSLPFASLACSLACTSGSKGRPAPTSQATS